HLPPPAPSPLSTLSLHDALPIWTACCILYMTWRPICGVARRTTFFRITHPASRERDRDSDTGSRTGGARRRHRAQARDAAPIPRSEEHTSELQSRSDLECRLLLE